RLHEARAAQGAPVGRRHRCIGDTDPSAPVSDGTLRHHRLRACKRTGRSPGSLAGVLFSAHLALHATDSCGSEPFVPSTRSTAAKRSSAENGFVKYSLHPASKHALTVSSRLSAEQMTMGISRVFASVFRPVATESPSMSGRPRSRTTRS